MVPFHYLNVIFRFAPWFISDCSCYFFLSFFCHFFLFFTPLSLYSQSIVHFTLRSVGPNAIIYINGRVCWRCQMTGNGHDHLMCCVFWAQDEKEKPFTYFELMALSTSKWKKKGRDNQKAERPTHGDKIQHTSCTQKHRINKNNKHGTTTKSDHTKINCSPPILDFNAK